MKISTKGRYALRLMLDLALERDQVVRLRDVAKRQDISVKYLEQIISVLQKCGYVKSVRGPGGGYLLAKKPEEYTVGMILRLTEGNMAVVSCLEGDVNECERQKECMTLALWQQISKAVNDVIDNTTLEDLIEWQKDK